MMPWSTAQVGKGVSGWLGGWVAGWAGAQLAALQTGFHLLPVAACPLCTVLHCAGLGARDLFGDASMYPVRGHVVRVRAPWVRHYVNAEASTGDCYIIPNTGAWQHLEAQSVGASRCSLSRCHQLHQATSSSAPTMSCHPLLSCCADTVVLGGTLQKGDADTTPREADRAAILGRAYSVLPSLRSAEIVSEWVSNIWPSRLATCVSIEIICN
jgi:glycine/D-amino acid oxidase-like deaminating enzyme